MAASLDRRALISASTFCRSISMSVAPAAIVRASAAARDRGGEKSNWPWQVATRANREPMTSRRGVGKAGIDSPEQRTRAAAHRPSVGRHCGKTICGKMKPAFNSAVAFSWGDGMRLDRSLKGIPVDRNHLSAGQRACFVHRVHATTDRNSATRTRRFGGVRNGCGVRGAGLRAGLPAAFQECSATAAC